MYFSITFTELTTGYKYNTWDTWHLVPTMRPWVEIPEVKTDYIDIPGANGSLDYTEALSGLNYSDSTGSWEFMALNTQDTAIDPTLAEYNWATLYRNIFESLHGRKVQIELESEPGQVYVGRVMVRWQTNSDRSTITFDYTIDTNDQFHPEPPPPTGGSDTVIMSGLYLAQALVENDDPIIYIPEEVG